ncbi:hypothetical protein BH10CYA1_BH10CYA1_63430 [soil metagenome]
MKAFPLPFTAVEHAFDALLEAWKRLENNHEIYMRTNQIFRDEFPELREIAAQLLNRARMIDILARLFVAKAAITNENRYDLAKERNEFEQTVDKFFYDSQNNGLQQFPPGNTRFASYTERLLLKTFIGHCSVMVSQAMTEVNVAESFAHRRLANPDAQQVVQAQTGEIFDGVDERYRSLFESMLAELFDPANVQNWLSSNVEFANTPLHHLNRGEIQIVEIVNRVKNREAQ